MVSKFYWRLMKKKNFMAASLVAVENIQYGEHDELYQNITCLHLRAHRNEYSFLA